MGCSIKQAAPDEWYWAMMDGDDLTSLIECSDRYDTRAKAQAALLGWLRTGDGMLAVIERMREMGWHMEYEPPLEIGDLYEVRFMYEGRNARLNWRMAEALPHVVAKAALAALGGGEK